MDKEIWPAEVTTRGACFADVLENIETARKGNSTEHQKRQFFVRMEHNKVGL